jgi:hypothetical protein
MIFLWSYSLVFLAAFFNAAMDTLENEPAFNRSVFKEWDKRFWSKAISWQYAKKILNYKVDGWHLAKSAMIFCLIGAVIVFRPHHQLWIHFLSMGMIWNITFESFYRLFKCK